MSTSLDGKGGLPGTVILKPGWPTDPVKVLQKAQALGCLIPQCDGAWASALYKVPLLVLKTHQFVEQLGGITAL